MRHDRYSFRTTREDKENFQVMLDVTCVTDQLVGSFHDAPDNRLTL